MAFPFAGTGVAGVFDPKALEDVYSTAIRNILMTLKGTVPYNPEFGSELRRFVFDLSDDIGKQLIQYYAFRDIQEQEPRLRVVALEANFDEDEYSVSFSVGFIAVADPEQRVRQANVGVIPLARRAA
jgi:phage baseplate assembly protein W